MREDAEVEEGTVMQQIKYKLDPMSVSWDTVEPPEML